MPTDPSREQPTIGSLVWRLSMKWRAEVDRAVAPLGLTHAQYTLLASLSAVTNSGVRPSQRQLADRVGLEPMYVSKLVRSLEGGGLVERATHPDDPRAWQLALTAKGQRTVERAVAVVRDLLDELTAPLGGARSTATRELAATLQTLIEHDRSRP